MPGAWRARSLVRKRKKHTSVVTTGSPKTFRHSLRDGFNAFLRALPGDRAFLPPSPARCVSTTRLRRPPAGARLAACKRPSHPAPNVRDDRDTPLLRAQDAGRSASDLPVATTEKAASDWHDGQIRSRREQTESENVNPQSHSHRPPQIAPEAIISGFFASRRYLGITGLQG